MKRAGIFLAIVAALFLAYAAWSYFFNSTVFFDGSAGNSKAPQAGNDYKSIPENILSSGEKSVESIKSFAAGIPGVVKGAFNSMVGGAKDAARDKLIDTLGTSSAPVSPSASGNPTNLTITDGAPRDSSAGPRVCSVVSKGEALNYGIDQPFAVAQGTSYKVDWGDGETAKGAFRSGGSNVVVSHSYARQGNYTIVFQVAGSSTSLTASYSVCVN